MSSSQSTQGTYSRRATPTTTRRASIPHKTLRASTTTTTVYPCDELYERRCADGTCYARRDLCPEEELVNKNTVLIMIVVGVAVTVFVVVLYCVQQKRRAHNTAVQTSDDDNISLNQPPPTYNEVMTTDLYPPTPHLSLNDIHNDASVQQNANDALMPPPNYVTALQILSRSQEHLARLRRHHVIPITRRSVSVDRILSKSFQDWSPPPPVTPLDVDNVFFHSSPNVPLTPTVPVTYTNNPHALPQLPQLPQLHHLTDADVISESAEDESNHLPTDPVHQQRRDNLPDKLTTNNCDVAGVTVTRCLSTDTQTTMLSLSNLDISHDPPLPQDNIAPSSAPVNRSVSDVKIPNPSVFSRSLSMSKSETYT